MEAEDDSIQKAMDESSWDYEDEERLMRIKFISEVKELVTSISMQGTCF
jgi:hypothetical protein